jgi:DME family drug/metabolite transporter
VPGLDELTVTGFGFTLGGLILMPLAAVLGGLTFRPGPEAVGLLIALGTGPTAVPTRCTSAACGWRPPAPPPCWPCWSR